MKRPFILGLTGSIGMGKSTTAQMFKDEGVPVWDADGVVHHLYSKDKAAIAAIGKLAPDATVKGFVDRIVLQQEILKDPDLLTRVEANIHPMVAKDRADFLSLNSDAPLVVFDIPLIFEKNLKDLCDEVLVVSIDAETQRQRVLSRDGMTQERLDYILSLQVPDQIKRNKADHLIETRTLDHVRHEVQKLIEQIKTGC